DQRRSEPGRGLRPDPLARRRLSAAWPAAGRVLRFAPIRPQTQDSIEAARALVLACRGLSSPRPLLSPRRLWRERRPWAIGLIAAALLAVAGAFVAYQALKRPADVHNQRAIERFVPQKPPPRPKKAKTVNWPMFGLTP